MGPHEHASNPEPEPSLTVEADGARREAEHTVNGVASKVTDMADKLRVPADFAKATQERVRSLRSAGKHLIDPPADETVGGARNGRRAPWRIAVAAVATVLFVRRLVRRKRTTAAAH